MLFILAGTTGPLVAASKNDYEFRRFWLSPKYFGSRELTLSVACLFAMAIGAYLAGWRRRSGTDVLLLSPRFQRLLRRTYRALSILTFIGYGLWFGKGVVTGLSLGDLQAALNGVPGAIRRIKETAAPIGGLTTLTQLGSVAAAIFTLLVRLGATRKEKRVLLGLLALGAFRSVFYAERLALLELTVPFLFAWAVFAPASASSWNVVLRKFAPVIAPLALLCVFGIFEHGRSWETYWKNKYDGSYSSFVTDRLTGYYATSSNNSALILQNFQRELRWPYYTVQFIWSAPLVGGAITRHAGVDPPAAWKAELENNANPEFNNEGGVLSPVVDYGVLGGIAYWVVVGGLLGRAWLKMRAGSVSAYAVMAVSVVGILEVDRYVYFGMGRYVPALLAVWVLARRARRFEEPSPAHESSDRPPLANVLPGGMQLD
jgi:hypothetical protein